MFGRIIFQVKLAHIPQGETQPMMILLPAGDVAETLGDREKLEVTRTLADCGGNYSLAILAGINHQ